MDFSVAATQPNVYRTIIDDVVANVRADFDEFGIEENLLALLQQVRYSPFLSCEGDI